MIPPDVPDVLSIENPLIVSVPFLTNTPAEFVEPLVPANVIEYGTLVNVTENETGKVPPAFTLIFPYCNNNPPGRNVHPGFVPKVPNLPVTVLVN